MNEVSMCGINHHLAPVELRERLAFGPGRLASALIDLRARIDAAMPGGTSAEVAILSTCNRTEVYCCASDLAMAGEVVRRFLAQQTSAIEASSIGGPLEPLLYDLRGKDAELHLMQVAAGLDSLVVGEDEIQGQVRSAGTAAQGAGTLGPVLAALFRHAVCAGKRVRAETEIGRTALSGATLVVELAESVLGSLADRTALLIGAGKMSHITGGALVRAGLNCVLVANRTFDRAERLAKSLGGRAVRFDALAGSLVRADIVICSTCAPHYLLHPDEIADAVAARPDRPLLIIDLAVPRDVDPAVAQIPGVRLADIDDLGELVEARHPLACSVRGAAERIVAEVAAEFQGWRKSRLSVPTIRALRSKAEAIRLAELERALRRLGDLSPEQQSVVEQMTRSIVNKLLHDPTILLKEPPPGSSQLEVIHLTSSMFGLN